MVSDDEVFLFLVSFLIISHTYIFIQEYNKIK